MRDLILLFVHVVTVVIRPKGPSADLIRAVVEMKERNPRWGCPRIAEQIALAFGSDSMAIARSSLLGISQQRLRMGQYAIHPSRCSMLMAGERFR